MINPSASRSAGREHIPLGPLYLAESLITKNYNVKIFVGSNLEIINSIIDNFNDFVIAFSISSMSGTQLKNAIELAKYLKQEYAGIPIIFGGVHTTTLPYQTLQAPYIDYIVWGEGEESLPQLLDSFSKTGSHDLSDIKGIGYKKVNELIITDKSDYTSLNKRVFSLPYELIPMEKCCRKLLVGPEKNYPIYSSRGCPYKCSFCSNHSKIWPNSTVRYHSIEHVVNDISRLITIYGADGITINDDNFFINQQRVIDFCNAINLVGFNKKVKFQASGRVNTFCQLPDEIWQKLKETGFVGFFMGVESGSQRILDIMRKGITIEQICQADEKLTMHGFYKTFTFLFCVPGETESDFKQTLQMIINLANTSRDSPYPFGGFNKYIPLPGTELFEIAMRDYGFKPPSSIEGWGHFDFEDFNCTTECVRPWLSKERVQYIDNIIHELEELNSLFIGQNRDDRKIDAKIQYISNLGNL